MQLKIGTVCYVVAVVTTAMVAVGSLGLLLALVALVFWGVVFSHENRPRALCYSFVSVATVLLLVGLYLTNRSQAGPAAYRAMCASRLKNVALALQNYHSVYGTFPPAVVTDNVGQPLHSWRVLILPYLDEQQLYDRYSFDEPWDGPNNRRLHSQVPYMLQCPSRRRRPHSSTETNFVAVIGPETIWNTDRKSTLDDINDGPASNTILLVECRGSNIHWMQPKDLNVDQAVSLFSSRAQNTETSGHPINSFFEQELYVLNVVLANGRVLPLNTETDSKVVAALLSIDGGEAIAHIPTLETIPGKLRWPRYRFLVVFGILVLLPIWYCRPNAKSQQADSDRSIPS